MQFSHCLKLLVALAVLGCALATRPLKLSDSVAPAGESPVQGVMALLLGRDSSSLELQLLDTTVALPPIDPHRMIKKYWVDSAQVGFAAALQDLVEHGAQRLSLDSATFAGLPAHLVSEPPSQDRFHGPSYGTWFLKVSRIGFNPDSTYAAVYHEYYCGPLCAGASVSLFARRPGRRWTFWDGEMLWIS